MSSIFLWKGCCVGVAADTETVDELCMIVRGWEELRQQRVGAYHGEARRSASLNRRPSAKDRAARPLVECAGSHAKLGAW